MLPHIITQDAITVFSGSKVLTMNASHRHFDHVITYLHHNGSDEDILRLMDPGSFVFYPSDAGFVIERGVVKYQGEVIEGYPVQKLLELLQEGYPIDPLVRFIVRLQNNPSARAVNELYQFLERGQLPLRPDGTFIAYKKITAGWKDIYSQTIDNSVGQVVSMPRNKVDDDSNQTCSFGLHVCSMDYLKSFGDGNARTIAVAVDPADVVSVPTDYNATKLRCCRYEVLAEIEQPTSPNPWDRPVVDDYDEDEDSDVNCVDEDDEDEGGPARPLDENDVMPCGMVLVFRRKRPALHPNDE